MNTTQLIGRLTADPGEVRDANDSRVASFRIAVPRPKGAQKDADFFTVEVWNGLAETCAKYLSEGREVAISGRLEQREWRGENDQPHERVIVVARTVDFLRGGKTDRETAAVGSSTAPDEDIPF